MAFPTDLVLLPIRDGWLLVSRDHAVFCPLSKEEARQVVGEGVAHPRTEAFSAALRQRLERHGFFDPPRPPGPVQPTVQIQLTNGCNLACAYCCTHSGQPRRQEMTWEEASALVDRIPEAMGPHARVALLGGEPLQVPWCLDLAERVRARDLDLTLFTNGVLLADRDRARRVARLVQGGALVRVSLAGAAEAGCDALSGAARFQAALEGIRALHEEGASVAVDVMLAPSNVGDLASHLPQLRRRLPPGTRVSVGLLFRGGRETGTHLFPSRVELEAALDRVAFEAGEVVPAVAPSPLAWRREACTCALGHHLHVRSDGAFFQCFRMEEPVGGLRDSERASFVDVARRLREAPRPARSLPACASCPLSTLCGGGCRSDNLLHTGDAEVPACGPWRVQVLCELLARDLPHAVEWPALHLLAEAHRLGLPAPATLPMARPSLHLLEP